MLQFFLPFAFGNEYFLIQEKIISIREKEKLYNLNDPMIFVHQNIYKILNIFKNFTVNLIHLILILIFKNCKFNYFILYQNFYLLTINKKNYG